MSNFILKFTPIRTFDDVIRRDGDLMWKILGNIHWTLLRNKAPRIHRCFFLIVKIHWSPDFLRVEIRRRMGPLEKKKMLESANYINACQ